MREMTKKQIHKHERRERKNPRHAERGYIDRERATKKNFLVIRDEEEMAVEAQVAMAYGVRL